MKMLSIIYRLSSANASILSYPFLHFFLLPVRTSLVPLPIKDLQTPLRSRHNIQRLNTDPLLLAQHENRAISHIVRNERLEAIHKSVITILVIPDTTMELARVTCIWK